MKLPAWQKFGIEQRLSIWLNEMLGVRTISFQTRIVGKNYKRPCHAVHILGSGFQGWICYLIWSAMSINSSDG